MKRAALAIVAAALLGGCRGPCAGCMYPLAAILPPPAPPPDGGWPVAQRIDAGPVDGGPSVPVPDGGWPEVD